MRVRTVLGITIGIAAVICVESIGTQVWVDYVGNGQ